MPGGSGERSAAVFLREARILDVDPVNYVCTVQFIRGEEPAEGVSFYLPYVSNRGGGWMGALPEVGDFALVAKPSLSESYSVIAYKPLPRQENASDSDQVPRHSYEEPRENYSMGRNPTTPGDQVMYGTNGNAVIVRRSGLTEVFADELTSTRWFPDEHAIRNICGSMETQGFFGVSQWYTLRDEEREAEGATPTGYSAWVKNHAEGAPIVNVELGAVVDDESLRIPGRPKRDNSTRGSVVARFCVFDQQFSNVHATHGELPPTSGARMAFWVDQEGNVQWLSTGTRTESVENSTMHVRGREVRRVEGGSRTEVIGDHVLSSRGAVSVRGDRGIRHQTGGDFIIDCGRLVVNERNGSRVVEGDYTVQAGQRMVLEGAGSLQLRTAGEGSFSVGRGRGDVVGGRYSMRVLNQADPENTGRDVAAYDIKVARGKAKFQVEQGSFEIVVGPSAPGMPPLARLKIFNDIRTPNQIGRIEIGFPLSGAGITMNPDGSFKLASGAAEFSGDAAGNVQMGKKGVPVAGHVISTASYPVDFVTGLPIPGHADIRASAGAVVVGAPVSPGVGVPPGSGPMLPTINLPDEPAA